MIMKKLFFILLPLLLAACTSGNKQLENNGENIINHASLLRMTDCGDYLAVDIINPWDTTTYLQRLALVPEESSAEGIEGRMTVTVPLKSSLVYSTVFAAAVEEIGRIDAVTAVADAEYFKQQAIIEGLQSGRVTSVGSSLSPNVELIVACRPAAILTSPYQNAGHGVIEQLGIPIIDMADYMETTPLGRAEWIRFIGALYGNREVADSIFTATEEAYAALKAKAPNDGPKVITEMLYSGVWYVPAGESYMAQMLRDAGGNYPWSDDTSTGSLQLDFASVYDKAHDADFWLVKSYGNDMTLKELRDAYPLNAKFDAYGNGGVYSVNTATSTFFEDYPFHPERLLRDYIIIFAPDSLPGEETTYYKAVK